MISYVVIVLKFGGTSLQDPARVENALAIVSSQLKRAPVLVSSAMGNTTDRLLRIIDVALTGNRLAVLPLLESLKGFHDRIASELLEKPHKEQALSSLESHFSHLGSLIQGLVLLKECTPRSRDAILSFGERISTMLLFHRSLERGIETILLDSRTVIKTNEDFGKASLLEKKTFHEIQEKVVPGPGRLSILQGFIASTETGVTTTLGRGGSDYTASIIGAALSAEEVQIWTDVSGILSADPRVVPSAQTLPTLSYEEARELAYFGAKVVHPSTILPTFKSQIPVLVKNALIPHESGTVITDRDPTEGVKAVTTKKGLFLITITSPHMVEAYGFLKRIFSIFEEHKTSVDLVTTSEASVTVTIEEDQRLLPIVSALETMGSVLVEKEKAIISLVGRGLWQDPHFFMRIFRVLPAKAVRLISWGASRINFSLVVATAIADEAIVRLHKEFFERQDLTSSSG